MESTMISGNEYVNVYRISVKLCNLPALKEPSATGKKFTRTSNT